MHPFFVKIPIGKKKIKTPIRLKITIGDDMTECLVAPGCPSGTHHQEHTTTGKERNTGKAEKPAYICMIADDEKKYKKVKKNLEIKKKVVPL